MQMDQIVSLFSHHMGKVGKTIWEKWDHVAAISKSFLWLQVGLFSLIEAENFGPENSPSNEIGRGCQMQDLFSVICNFVVSN